jgi:hypothetical protein
MHVSRLQKILRKTIPEQNKKVKTLFVFKINIKNNEIKIIIIIIYNYS